MSQILEQIENPGQLKRLSIPQLEKLAMELRALMIESVSKTGGHLAPSLGTVDLTLALYSVFDAAEDTVVWDVGHQAYAHKILTGRRERFGTLRQKDGITGFPKRAESPYDAFGTGHASTSISAALGMAIVRDLEGRHNHVLAVIGDGALTGGEAFEALNHAGDMGRNLIVVLNDNEMSIDRNVGAMSEYLSRIRVAPQYNRAKKDLEGLLKSIPKIGDTVLKTAGYIKEGVRAALVPGGLFDEMGFTYVGPIDGHNIRLMKEVFAQVAQLDGPVLVHVRTKKGKGYLPAEIEPERFHGVGPFNALTGKKEPQSSQPPSYTQVFSDAMLELAAQNPDILAITAAMPAGTGLKAFSERYPERFFDVGIAEEHAVTLAAGIAAAGKRPVAAIYSTFAQRAYDQMLHDVCLQNLPVVFCLDRAGLVGADGPTHHGVFDLSYLRQMPNMTVMVPKDENELRQMLYTALQLDGPAAIRYPRGTGLGVELDSGFAALPVGKAEVLTRHGRIALLAVGSMVDNASKAAIELAGDGIETTVVNMRFVKPLDTQLLRELSKEMDYVVTIEENVLAGGFGSAVAEFLIDEEIKMPMLRIGIGDEFVEQGTRDELWELCGLQPAQIADKVKKFWNRNQ